MLVPSVVTFVPLPLSGPTPFRLTGSPSGSLHPASPARFVIAICHVAPGTRLFVTLLATVGGRSLVTTRYNSLLETASEVNWPETTPPPFTAGAGKPAPETK